jgi:hypothetical protein
MPTLRRQMRDTQQAHACEQYPTSPQAPAQIRTDPSQPDKPISMH